ncbi:GPP34 family phosphoprotein [Actinoplanes sp. DH11]|uniref:GOLPH3/VPS74 family protein n=1 Tax=Actinoplanes sp. DH11 TaxID=2857011 RepID=UPI001E43EFDD|nr:GPP34 family phosphoprotein [Actinoplanes sp. DH11]
MQNDMLLVEDLALLLLDDETGVPAGAGTLSYTLGGAVLVDLALRGRIESDDEGRSWLTDPKVHATGTEPLGDPLLQEAFERVSRKPRSAQTLLIEIGSRLWNPVTERLIERGLIRRETKRVLGLFRSTRLPAADAEHEQELRRKIRAVLVDGAEPDARTAALTALLSASGALPALRPQLAWSSDVAKRAKQLESGNWGAAAVSTAVTRTAAAIAASSTAVAIAVTTTTTT